MPPFSPTVEEERPRARDVVPARDDDRFPLQRRLPPYLFNTLDKLKQAKIAAAERGDGPPVIDFGMGNPDQGTPLHIVQALVQAAGTPGAHRYAPSHGIPRLREAICGWYHRRYGVALDPDREAVVTIGSKEGLSHLALAAVAPGDTVLVPDPAYPIHNFAFVVAGAKVVRVTLGDDPVTALERAILATSPRPRLMLLNFPSNPTGRCATLAELERIVALARRYGTAVLHDLSYADIVFDGPAAPSILQVPGAREVAVETFTLSKSYNMPGWRVGFLCGNARLAGALRHIKTYLDYGSFQPIQEAAASALEGAQDCVAETRALYRRRRDHLCRGLRDLGWPVTPPPATMFVWAPIPDPYRDLGSLAFAEKLLDETGVVVSPGIGFGPSGDGHVRFSLIQDDDATDLALEAIAGMFRRDGLAQGGQP